MSRLRISLRRSVIGSRREHRETVRALGLRRIGQRVVRPDTPAVRGMVRAVSHLVSVEKLPDGQEDE